MKTSFWKKLYQQSFDELSLFDYKFSPIYDSGSSLGREMNEEQIEAFIGNPEEILKYIKRGVSEIKLNGKNKTHHFEIIHEISGKYKDTVTSCRNLVLTKYSYDEICNIINHVDDDLDIKYTQNKLTLSRKKLIINIIKYRVEFFKTLNFEN